MAPFDVNLPVIRYTMFCIIIVPALQSQILSISWASKSTEMPFFLPTAQSSPTTSANPSFLNKIESSSPINRLLGWESALRMQAAWALIAIRYWSCSLPKPLRAKNLTAGSGENVLGLPIAFPKGEASNALHWVIIWLMAMRSKSVKFCRFSCSFVQNLRRFLRVGISCHAVDFQPFSNAVL